MNCFALLCCDFGFDNLGFGLGWVGFGWGCTLYSASFSAVVSGSGRARGGAMPFSPLRRSGAFRVLWYGQGRVGFRPTFVSCPFCRPLSILLRSISEVMLYRYRTDYSFSGQVYDM